MATSYRGPSCLHRCCTITPENRCRIFPALIDIRLAVDGAPLGDPIEWLPAIEQFGEGFFIHIDGLILRTGLEDQASKREQKSFEKGSLAEELRKMAHRVAGFRAWNMFRSIVLLMH